MFKNRNLRYIAPNVFNGLDWLEKIDMYGSALESIDFDMFNCVPSLSCLVINSDNSRLLNRDFIKKVNESKKYKFYIC